MQFASLFVPFLIVPAGYARPRDVTRKQLGVWTLFNNIISCDDTKCFHSFDLYEQYDQEAQNCQFIVMATATSEPDRTDFQLVQCGSDGQFLVNGGHMTGSPDIVLVITNTMEMTWASFGYDQEEFLYGPHKESPSYHFGDFPTSNSEMAELIGLQPRCGWAMTEGRRGKLWNRDRNNGVHFDADTWQ